VRYHDEVVAREGTSANEVEQALRQRVAALEAALTTANETLTKTTDVLSHTAAELASVTQERDKLRRAYELLKAEVELLRRRIFLAKTERIDTEQLELEFAQTNARLTQLAKQLGEPADSPELAPNNEDAGARGPTSRKPKGRRNLRDLEIPEVRSSFVASCKEIELMVEHDER
jgi:chromosome segregation ATPase